MNLIFLAIFLVFFIFAYQKWHNDLRNRFFAWFMNMMTKKKNPKWEEFKKELFKSLSSTVSHVPELRKINAVKVLEIGAGTGVNFEYYPEGSKLIVVDPNPHFKSYYNENRSKYSNIAAEEIIVSTGEEMDMVEDNSVDVVVSTHVLCSVKDVCKIYQQVRRVLVPGGKFYYLEHIREWDSNKHKVRQFLHDILSISGIWPFLFDGCHLNRDMLADIEASGFSKVDGSRQYCPIRPLGSFSLTS